MISAIKLKNCITSAGILGVIVGDFCHKKKPCPIILLEVDKGSEVDFSCTILPLSLAIYLRVEGGGKFLFDAKKIA